MQEFDYEKLIAEREEFYSRAREYKIALDRKIEENSKLRIENDMLRKELDQKQSRIYWLEGKVEAFEYCVKNGRVK